MFQGGFAGKECEFYGVVSAGHQTEAAAAAAEGAAGGAAPDETEAVDVPPCLVKLGDFLPEDSSTLQEFAIECTTPITQLKLAFNSSTDFYGRVTVYSLEVLGRE
mmetsp:Transcript_33715/g.88631  ORF Transcript_33715/g.88631 Transcript_33715/m.88631 type:complete len:105 (+) Transcript_33715:87-401(+)